MGISASGDLDSAQTRQVMQLDTNISAHLGRVFGLCLYSSFILHLKHFQVWGDIDRLQLVKFKFCLLARPQTFPHLRQSVAGGDLGRFQAVGLGLGAEGAGNAPEGPQVPSEKPKKNVPLSKQLTTKISSSSTKLTELMAWETKVADNKTLYLILIYIPVAFACFAPLLYPTLFYMLCLIIQHIYPSI